MTDPTLPREAGATGAVIPRDSIPEDPSLAELLKRLADDGRLLFRQEIQLATQEVQATVTTLARSSGLLAGGLLVLVLGLLVLLVFVILALGRLLGGEYWLSTLIMGGLLSIGGVALLLAGRRGLAKESLTPSETVESVRESGEWARAEARQIRQDLTS